MKKALCVLSCALIFLSLGASQHLQAEMLIYLVDPDELADFQEAGIDVYQMDDEEELEKILSGQHRPPQYVHWQRLYERALQDQRRLVRVLDEFVETSFDPYHLEATPRFLDQIEKIVSLVFRAPRESDYIQRLVVVNQYYLKYRPAEEERFQILDRAMAKEDLKIKRRRKQIREFIIGATSLTGAALGAYFTFKVSQKAFPILATEPTLALVMKWSGRGVFIFFGTSFGAAVGSFVGFLGSDYLLFRQYDYFRPVDGDEDLIDLLEHIDSQSR